MPVYLDPAGSYLSGFVRGQQANMQRQQFITSQVSAWLGLQDNYQFDVSGDLADYLSSDPFRRREQLDLDNLIRVRLDRRAASAGGGGSASAQGEQGAFGDVNYAAQGQSLLAALLGGGQAGPGLAAPQQEQPAAAELYSYPQPPAPPQAPPPRTVPPAYDFGPSMRRAPPASAPPAAAPQFAAPAAPAYQPAAQAPSAEPYPVAGAPPLPRPPSKQPTGLAPWVNQQIVGEGTYVYQQRGAVDEFYRMLDEQ